MRDKSGGERERGRVLTAGRTSMTSNTKLRDMFALYDRKRREARQRGENGRRREAVMTSPSLRQQTHAAHHWRRRAVQRKIRKNKVVCMEEEDYMAWSDEIIGRSR